MSQSFYQKANWSMSSSPSQSLHDNQQVPADRRSEAADSSSIYPGFPAEGDLEEDFQFGDKGIPQSLFHGSWSLEKDISEAEMMPCSQETNSIISFKSDSLRPTAHRLNTKVEMVYSLLSMLGTHDRDDMSKTLLAMSRSADSCLAMRQSGCLPLLVQLLHGSETAAADNGINARAARQRATAALHNIVFAHPDDKRTKREMRILHLLEIVRGSCEALRDSSGKRSADNDGGNKDVLANETDDNKTGQAVTALMKFSFDAELRQVICTLGGLQALAELLQYSHEFRGSMMTPFTLTIHRYICMTLTNLTFGDGGNKALLCSMRGTIRAIVAQLRINDEDLRQEAASVLRNLSWHADITGKAVLRDVGAMTALTQAAVHARKESTLKSVLSALWNLSAHCSENKADVCAVPGALAFLSSCLTYESPSKSLAVVESGGGILRNISSHIAVREDYRQVLRDCGTLQVLLAQLRSTSLTIVSNACGTLWNLSARCLEDQRTLWQLGAVNMLRSLVNSKHKMISTGSAAALKNLIAVRHLIETGMDVNSVAKTKLPVTTQHGTFQQLNNVNGNMAIEMFDGYSASPNGLVSVAKKQQQLNVYNILGNNNNVTPLRSNAALTGNIMSSESFRPVWPGNNSAAISGHRLENFQNVNNISIEQDEPIDYSRKYVEGNNNCIPVSTAASVVSASQTPVLSRPAPAFTNPSQFVKPAPVTNNAVRKSVNARNKTNILSNSTRRTDSGVDQVTNFGAKFAENDDSDLAFLDQPINYSTRYKEPERADVGMTRISSSAEELRDAMRRAREQDYGQDQLQTFCTEGTPMSFLSAAGSLENLRTVGLAKAPLVINKVPSVANSAKMPENLKKVEVERLSTAGSHSTSNATGSTVMPKTVQPVVPHLQESSVATLRMGSSQVAQQGAPHLQDCMVLPRMNSNLIATSSASSQLSSLPPSLYSYNDSITTGSPNDKPRLYCTEGTPVNMSRVSSLSSLHSSEANEQLIHASGRHDVTLPSIDENKSLDTSMATATKSVNKVADNSHLTTKSVTFGESSVQETPLMFSRCSSLGSLNSCDMHSMHSSVISEYSRRTSEVVSPSELPESPGDTMPSSPKSKYPPPQVIRLPIGSAIHKPQVHMGQPVMSLVPRKIVEPAKMMPPQVATNYMLDVQTDQPVKYMEEGSPYVGLSHATSLSALTIDSDVQMAKETNTKKLLPECDEVFSGESSLLANDSLLFDSTVLERTVVEKSAPNTACKEENNVKENMTSGFEAKCDVKNDNTINVNDSICDDDDMLDFDDGSPVSKDEETLLAECINLAMPSSQAIQKMKQSASDGLIKTRTTDVVVKQIGSIKPNLQVSNNYTQSKPVSRIPVNPTAKRSINLNSSHVGTMKNSSTMPAFASNIEENYGIDSPKKFATEGTPLNFSRTGSFGDLSTPISLAGSENGVRIGDVDGDSDISLSDDDNEKLLEEVIAAAMPKSVPNSKPLKKTLSRSSDRDVEGSDNNRMRMNALRTSPGSVGKMMPQQPVYHPKQIVQSRPNLPSQTQSKQLQSNPKTVTVQEVRYTHQPHQPATAKYQPVTFSKLHVQSNAQPNTKHAFVPDRPQSAGMDRGNVYANQPSVTTNTKSQSVLGCNSSNVYKSDRVQQQQQPFSRGVDVINMSPYVTSVNTGMSDSVKVFEVEGTPLQFSRSDSLSSLSSCDDLNSLHGFLTDMPNQLKKIKALTSDKHSTPVGKPSNPAISQNSLAESTSQLLPALTNGILCSTPAAKHAAVSMQVIEQRQQPQQLFSETSSLSMDSFSFETPSESLLDECIRSAMPSSNSMKTNSTPCSTSHDPVTTTSLARTSPSGSSGVSSHQHSPQTSMKAVHRHSESLREEKEEDIDDENVCFNKPCAATSKLQGKEGLVNQTDTSDSSKNKESGIEGQKEIDVTCLAEIVADSQVSFSKCTVSDSKITVNSEAIRIEAIELSENLKSDCEPKDSLSGIENVDVSKVNCDDLINVGKGEQVKENALCSEPVFVTTPLLVSDVNKNRTALVEPGNDGVVEERDEGTSTDNNAATSNFEVDKCSMDSNEVFLPPNNFQTRSHTLPRATAGKKSELKLFETANVDGKLKAVQSKDDGNQKSRKSSVKSLWQKHADGDKCEDKKVKKKDKKKDEKEKSHFSLWPFKKKDKSAVDGTDKTAALNDLMDKLNVTDNKAQGSDDYDCSNARPQARTQSLHSISCSSDGSNGLSAGCLVTTV